MPRDIYPSSPPSTPLSPTAYKIALHRISPGERLIYYLYLPLLLLILFLLAILAALPYLFFKRARPRLLPGSRPDPKYPKSKYEWYGHEKDYPLGLALTPLGQDPGVKRRVWEMYGYLGEFWHMTTRQGLQVGGVGSGVVILAAATLSTSPDWGVTSLIQLRYVVITAIFPFGTYNLFRTFTCALGMATFGFRHTDDRVGRKPLRPWTESEWIDPYYRQNFIPHKYDRYFLTERWQVAVGDWNFPLERRPKEDVERQMDEFDGLDSFMMDGGIQKVWQRSSEEIRRMHGKIGWSVIQGGPKKMPPHMTNDFKQRERIHIGLIDPRNPPTDEEEEEMVKALNVDKGHFGIANWKPRTRSFGWWRFDMRRVWAILYGLALMGMWIRLCVFDLDYSSLASMLQNTSNIKGAVYRSLSLPAEARIPVAFGTPF
ncbi:uncharacterized protein IAS62_004219 [Cryptococcus decagattii]|uniref:Uncharacterized protein n=1 Tax=Cryptococcus decagattii TaxID=1859122 RepID=A0ABZ2B092_9TREE